MALLRARRPSVADVLSFIDGLLCAACLVFAAHAPRAGRDGACLLAVTFVLMQALYWLSWSYAPPASLFWGWGLMIEPTDLWALQDSVVGVVAVTVAATYRLKWVWALFWVMVATELGHSAYSLKLWAYSAYEWYLLGTFWASVACFAWGGGGNVRDRISGWIDRVRGLHGVRDCGAVHSSSSVSRRARTR